MFQCLTYDLDRNEEHLIERNLYKGMKKKKKYSQFSIKYFTLYANFSMFWQEKCVTFFETPFSVTMLIYFINYFSSQIPFCNALYSYSWMYIFNSFNVLGFSQVIGQFIMKKRKIADIFHYKRKSFCNFFILCWRRISQYKIFLILFFAILRIFTHFPYTGLKLVQRTSKK